MNDFNLKKRTSNINIKLYSLIALILLLSIGTGIGYSYIRKELSVNGKVELKASSSNKASVIFGKDIIAYYDDVASPYVTASTGINFAEPNSDTNGKGLYIKAETKDDEYPIYYYRGAVQDNNLIFADFCWKIVRTTEQGGIKLLYNGTPNSGTCSNYGTNSQIGTSSFNASYNDTKYLGYMYDTNESSTIKKYLDEWYKTNLNTYTNKLEDAIWCNDRSDTSSTYGGYTYGAYLRVERAKNPRVKVEEACPAGNVDRYTVKGLGNEYGNANLDYSIGLLTADEVALGGYVASSSTVATSSYLHSGESYFTMSPHSSGGSPFNANVFFVSNIGYLGSITTASYYYSGINHDNVRAVRPSIVLKNTTKITGGDGTASKPYLVD